MYLIKTDRMTLSLDLEGGSVCSLLIDGTERISSRAPLFRVGLRSREGELFRTSVFDAEKCKPTEDGAVYSGFAVCEELSVRIHLTATANEAQWRIEAEANNGDFVIEWIDFPMVSLPKLKDNEKNGLGGQILYPFNEGVLVSDMERRKKSFLCYKEPSYPSMGIYSVFPNMVCSQMLSYIWDDASLYIGAEDGARSPKAIDFFDDGEGTTMQIRLYTGSDFGLGFKTDYPIVWSVCDGSWESSAERYRTWFEQNLPPRVKKIEENPYLPEWYEDAPLIVSYPVRGIHDTDEMKPNALYPYTNGLPLVKEIKDATNAKIMVLLMHWEGTAPWAPPYVWPPFGGEDNFKKYLSELHGDGNMLGVYCSGFGYTMQSNLTPEYDMKKEFFERGLEAAMCRGPLGNIESKICTEQRRGYDICPASDMGRRLLLEAYEPLFNSGIDYAQILDQNHGGGQYLCYSRDHGHPPVPGKWMTENMQGVLGDWNERARNTLFGCESAASEPFIGNLLFSDNRYELNYDFGAPTPLYAYIYHEYLRNFMGNQVCCPFPTSEDTLCYRLAYSFSIGDSMTLVLSPSGDIMSHWGTRDFEHSPKKEKVYTLIRNLTRFYREQAKPYLYAGRMTAAEKIDCGKRVFRVQDENIPLPAVLCSAWLGEDGKRATILVNPEEDDLVCRIGEREITVPALDAVLITDPTV